MKKIYTLTILFIYVIAATAQGTWTQKANFGGTCRKFAAGFGINTKGYIVTGEQTGGTDINGPLWEYNQTTDVWSSLNSFVGNGRAWAFGCSVGNQNGYVIGGANIGGPFTDNEEYDPIANGWSALPSFPGVARYAVAGFVIGAKIYLGTGDDLTNLHNDFWVYDLGSGSWTQKANFGGTPRRAAVGFAIGTTGFMGTGMDGVIKNDMWAYNPTTNTWTQKNNFGGSARQYAVAFAMNNKGFIGTGNDGLFTTDFWEYDPTGDAWSQVSSMPANPRWGAVAMVINGKAYVGTGGTNSAYYCDWWEYNPSLVGVNETVTENTFSVFPNPSNGNFTVNSEITKGEIVIYNVEGEKILSENSSGKTEIDLTNQPKGIYFVQIKSGEQISSKKIIIQ